MSTDYRYTVRNVAQKEIYDSYMGILRISPNLDDNGKMVDDPTNFLNTIGCKKIQLSSSNGDPLPVHFVPYAFNTSNVFFNVEGNGIRETKNIINICTDTTLTNYATGNTYVSESFISRSSIHLIEPKILNKKNSKIAIAYGCNQTDDDQKANCKGILLYPFESPNDSKYFNNKNNLKLFDTNDSRPRPEQVEEALLKKSLQWYNTTLNDAIYYPKDKDGNPDKIIDPTGADKKIQNHRVKANNQYINQFNDRNEEIPVLYSRDYVLGHYEGHSQKTNTSNRAAMKSHFLPASSQVYEAEENEVVTKLSWVRFDNLVWECLDEVLSGKLRHVAGRYSDLGTAIGGEGNSISEKLFGTAEVKGFSECTNLYASESPSQFLDYTAPLVGKGVQEGMIMYHAMPFHRYWFHRCRQVLFNMEEFKRQFQLAYNDGTAVWADINNDERSELQKFYDDKLITPCCKASITPHHSLVKDFLLCNGQEANLTNFPNISLNNNNLLKDTKYEIKNGVITTSTIDLVKGKQSTPDYTSKKFKQKSSWNETTLDAASTYNALKLSLGGTNGIKLPNLFNFQEKYPRFIRGLNWSTDTENIQNFDIEVSKDNYVDKILGANIKNMAYIKKDLINTKNNVWGDKGKCIVKNFTDVSKPYYFSFDYLTQKSNHRHLLFAKKNGLTSKSSSYTTLVNFKYHTNIATPVMTEYVKTLPILNNNHECSAENLAKSKGYESWTTWYDYNFGVTKRFLSFQPVKTAGLYYFNKDFTTSSRYNVSDNSKWCYYDARGEKHLMNVANISSDSKTYTEQDPPQQPPFEIMNQYRYERNKRKQLIIKLNESEGAYPLSIYGGPSIFQTKQEQSWQRKRTSLLKPRYEWEHGSLTKTNIATYKLFGIDPPDKNDYKAVENVKNGTHWRTMTSLQYWDCDKLGVGDISAIEKEKYLKRDSIPPTASDYYNYNNVTDIWREASKTKSEEITYGSTVTKVDTSAPYPSFLNLIPLIRL